MQRFAFLVACACAGCAHPPAVAPSPPAPSPPAAPVAPAMAAESPWAGVPVRVMTWTPHGVRQLGVLPGELPQPMPALWYVEPIAPLDQARFRQLVERVRADHVPGLSLRNQAGGAGVAGAPPPHRPPAPP